MKNSLIDNILRERAFKNERTVAIVRLGIFSFYLVIDTLAYFGYIEYTEIRPALRTVLLDCFVFLVSGTIVFLLINKFYHDSIKFLAITFDYSIIAVMLVIEPTVPKGGQLIYWVVYVASIFPFLLNLLRYSKSGAIYSSVLSISLFLGLTTYYNNGDAENIIPMHLNLVLMLLIGYSITSASRKMMEEANTKRMMERYLPPQLVDELYKKNVNMEPGGEMRKVTILFSDIRSFTTISERLDAKSVVSILNAYLSVMTEIIFRFQGTIDKFIGDAIMTVFGAPMQKNDDAIRAVKTAISMQEAMRSFNENHSELKEPIEIGIGIHTGEVVAGNIGSEKRIDYTVIGDNVNLSSRIESLTKIYKCPILISSTTYTELHHEISQNEILAREVDTVIVKGKTNSIKIYEVMCFFSEEEKILKRKWKFDFENALEFYKQKDFEKAMFAFERIKLDPLSEFYRDRCKEFLKNPPEKIGDGNFANY
ncbi:adenylate/guanylate cyclase domain-containing protein [Leptospira sp. 201903074]|uniref:adenylate/guanylate cyclase domain-containing protein n=1 Tax=Leptospira abararensis TaxID=2810036 RepID=UPI001965B512|nr:adenylate/guanylate cyclase domain-containing protein [Leptospira abararensis]MBM9545837.1 adenylate/guanylate cyclase domain-containing protein [Leptospira abararensis]